MKCFGEGLSAFQPFAVMVSFDPIDHSNSQLMSSEKGLRFGIHSTTILFVSSVLSPGRKGIPQFSYCTLHQRLNTAQRAGRRQTYLFRPQFEPSAHDELCDFDFSSLRQHTMPSLQMPKAIIQTYKVRAHWSQRKSEIYIIPVSLTQKHLLVVLVPLLNGPHGPQSLWLSSVETKEQLVLLYALAAMS